jgi:hypothetical protein
VVVERSVAATAAHLGEDGHAYQSLMTRIVEGASSITDAVLSPRRGCDLRSRWSTTAQSGSIHHVVGAGQVRDPGRAGTDGWARRLPCSHWHAADRRRRLAPDCSPRGRMPTRRVRGRSPMRSSPSSKRPVVRSDRVVRAGESPPDGPATSRRPCRGGGRPAASGTGAPWPATGTARGRSMGVDGPIPWARRRSDGRSRFTSAARWKRSPRRGRSACRPSRSAAVRPLAQSTVADPTCAGWATHRLGVLPRALGLDRRPQRRDRSAGRAVRAGLS